MWLGSSSLDLFPLGLQKDTPGEDPPAKRQGRWNSRNQQGDARVAADLAVTEAICDRVVALPMFDAMTPDEVCIVCDAFRFLCASMRLATANEGRSLFSTANASTVR